MGIVISRLQKKDLREAQKLLRDTILDFDFFPLRERREDARDDAVGMAKNLSSRDWDFLVAKSDGRIVGLFTAYMRKSTYWIDWIVTSREARRSGVATALMREGEKLARRKSRSMMGDVAKRNRASIALLNKTGFRKVALYKDYVHGRYEYFFEKKLR
ncbi:MAG: GNAT family N-acetyltransferase [Candidatus Micrarchaeales archaeon]|nr:GNAT family N-acetyltransferase [Candidatus Micrarchaeales archaeon]